MLRQYINNRRVFSVLFLGFSSGLPLALTSSTLQAWFTQSGVSLMSIGFLSLLGLPYVWKFLWSPLLDRFSPFLGRRRGWILVTQIGLCLALFVMAQYSPQNDLMIIGFLALGIAFISASQDIAVDAYRTDILHSEERGTGAAAYIFAYRIAMLVSGGLALVMADRLGWRVTYEIMSVMMLLSTIATFCAPKEPGTVKGPKTFSSAVVSPFLDLLRRDKILLILLFIFTYKIGDALALSLMSNFLLRHLGFTLTDIGLALKTCGLLATIIGAFVGGALLIRMSLFSALLSFGLLQAFSNLMFVLLAIAGKSYLLMIGSIFVENFCSGMSTSAFVAFLMSLCNHRYTATQFAVLSALAAVGRVISGPIASLFVEQVGWTHFFGWAFLMSFPGIIVLTLLRGKVGAKNAEVII